MIKVPTNQDTQNGACVGKATSSGVYVAGRKVAGRLGNYTGGVIVVRSKGFATVIKMPQMIADND